MSYAMDDKQVNDEPTFVRTYSLSDLLNLAFVVSLQAGLCRILWDFDLFYAVTLVCFFGAPLFFLVFVFWFCPKERNNNPRL